MLFLRGTTPIHSFALPEELNGVELAALHITYRQDGRTVLEKTLDEVSIGGNIITIRLTQEEALADVFPRCSVTGSVGFQRSLMVWRHGESTWTMRAVTP